MSGSEPLIGVVNAGSSSLKFALYDGEALVLSGQVEGIGTKPAMHAASGSAKALPVLDFGSTPPETPGAAFLALLPWLRDHLGGRALAAIGHRVVHGGPYHDRPLQVTPALLDELGALSRLAPLHQPHNLSPIRAAYEHNPRLPQIACFDTAFHRTMPLVAQAFALPRELTNRGVRRYGFHGLSYEYIASRLPEIAPALAEGRTIVAHLGNGASLCALHRGRSVATTMGFSALDGLPMGTRCGDLDPAVVIHLIRFEGMSPEGVEDMLYRRSGMLGLSGVSSDFRDLLGSSHPEARFALEVFVHRVARHIGSLAAALGGMDGLVFTAGVGENSPRIRAAICNACAWLGLDLDPEANESRRGLISQRESQVSAYVIPTDENLMIARHSRAVIGA